MPICTSRPLPMPCPSLHHKHVIGQTSTHRCKKKDTLEAKLTLKEAMCAIFRISGFNDVSWHNREILTPNMESLVREGIALESNYVQPICTPTRSALMTGYYPIHTGRQVSNSKSVNSCYS